VVFLFGDALDLDTTAGRYRGLVHSAVALMVGGRIVIRATRSTSPLVSRREHASGWRRRLRLPCARFSDPCRAGLLRRCDPP